MRTTTMTINNTTSATTSAILNIMRKEGFKLEMNKDLLFPIFRKEVTIGEKKTEIAFPVMFLLRMKGGYVNFRAEDPYKAAAELVKKGHLEEKDMMKWVRREMLVRRIYKRIVSEILV